MLPAPISKGGVADVEIGTAMVTAKPVGNHFCGVWRTVQGAALLPSVVNRSTALLAPRVDSVANLSISTRLDTIGWRSCC
jgi:hypothetical protein